MATICGVKKFSFAWKKGFDVHENEHCVFEMFYRGRFLDGFVAR